MFELFHVMDVGVDSYRATLSQHKRQKACGRVPQNTVGEHTAFSELRSCVKVEVAVLGSPSLIVFMVSVDVKQH